MSTMLNVGDETTSGKALLECPVIDGYAATTPWFTGTVGPLEVEECEAVATYAYERVGLDPSVPVAPGLLCSLLFGTRPQVVSELPSRGLVGRLGSQVRIYIRADAPPHRQRFIACHEVAHGLLGRVHNDADVELEKHCDAIAACLLAPAPAFRALCRKYTSIYDLAHALGVSQALAMLRLGEVTGRPVRLLGSRVKTRGEPFDWPDSSEALKGLHRCRVHPIRLADEGKWGLMAVGGVRRAG